MNSLLLWGNIFGGPEGMTPFYLTVDNEHEARLEGDEARHCIKVMRFKKGDTIIGIDGTGYMYQALVTGLGKDLVTLDILKRTLDWGEHPQQIVLAFSPLHKPDRLEWMVEKAVELGVTQLVPYLGKNTVKTGIRLGRLERIMISALKQSLRSRLPEIEEPVSFQEMIALYPDAFRIVATAQSSQTLFNLSEKMQKAGQIYLLIGPEGDFTEKELQEALETGFQPVKLGENRLRSETAAIHLLGGVKYLAGY